jgi:hypothetical protein
LNLISVSMVSNISMAVLLLPADTLTG